MQLFLSCSVVVFQFECHFIGIVSLWAKIHRYQTPTFNQGHYNVKGSQQPDWDPFPLPAPPDSWGNNSVATRILSPMPPQLWMHTSMTSCRELEWTGTIWQNRQYKKGPLTPSRLACPPSSYKRRETCRYCT